MTNEEVEALIAEISLVLKNPYTGLAVPTADVVEKIIRRFANKPPKEGWMSNDNSANCFYLRECDPPNEYCCLHVNFSRQNRYENFYMNKGKLTELRDNINKMLQYLEGEDEQNN